MRLVEELRVVDERAGGADVDAPAQAEQVVDRGHPACVTAGQVIVDGDEVRALAREGVEVEGKARHESLALAGLHLGDLALVQDQASDQLHVEVAEPDGAAAGLPAERKGLDQNVVEVGALLPRTLAELLPTRPPGGGG